VDRLTKAIQTACGNSMPLRKRKKKLCLWWTSELETAKSDVQFKKRRLYNAIITPPPEAVEEFAKAKRAYAELTHKTCIESWKNYIGHQGKDNVWSNVYRLLKDAPLPKPPTTLHINNNRTTNAIDTAKALLNHFYPDDDFNNETSIQNQIRNSIDVIRDINEFDAIFTTEEVIEVLSRMNPNKAPGHDNLTADIVLKFAKNNETIITGIYNKCLHLGLFPTAWKLANVKILPKPGKENYEQLESYRPIGLLPVLGKGLESLFKQRINWDFHKRQQFGFTEQTSTLDAVRSAINQIQSAKSRGLQVMAVSLDIKSAFDNAWWPALLNGLLNRNIKTNIYRLVQHYLIDRKVTLDYAGETVSKITSKGCVQGSVCGPTFWNVILDDIFKVELPEGCYIQAFADDVLLICHNKNANTLQTRIEEALNLIAEWGLNVKLTFGAEKTQAIGFTKHSRQINICMNGVNVYVKSEIKLLGIMIDENLKFTQHVNYAITKAQRLFKNLVKIARPT
jgi:hypothetical protein